MLLNTKISRKEALELLAKHYVQLAQKHNIVTAKDLSQLTYRLRETEEPNLPYLRVATTDVNYTPAPTARQKDWYQLLVKPNVMDLLKSPEGYSAMWVNVLSDGFEIQVITRWSRSFNKAPRVDFSIVIK